MFSEVISSRTHDVVVSVQTAYVAEQSNVVGELYVFAYRICITNESTETVQLLRREWHITDGYGQKRKVEGEGVVGLQPILAPGQTHEYISRCDFHTPIGQMRGHYVMVNRETRAEFKVKIPKFTMGTPATLN